MIHDVYRQINQLIFPTDFLLKVTNILAAIQSLTVNKIFKTKDIESTI